MSFTYEIDQAQELAIFSCSQELEFDYLCDGLDKLTKHPEFAGVKKVVVYLTYEVCVQTSHDEVERNASVTLAALQNKPVKIAIIAPHDLTYGVCRMFLAYANHDEIDVFRSLPEAFAWLQVKNPLLEAPTQA